MPLRRGTCQLPADLGGTVPRVVRNSVLLIHIGLMFGFVNSPAVWTKVYKVPMGVLRRKGRRVTYFMDDGMGMTRSEAEGSLVLEEVAEIHDRLGFDQNHDKTEGPTQVIPRRLGFKIDSVKGVFSVPEDRRKKLRRTVASFRDRMAKGKGWVTKKEYASLVGQLGSMELACGLMRLHTRSMVNDIHSKPGWGRRVMVRVSKRARKEEVRMVTSPHFCSV